MKIKNNDFKILKAILMRTGIKQHVISEPHSGGEPAEFGESV